MRIAAPARRGLQQADARDAIDWALLDPDESGDGCRPRPAHRDFGAVPGVVGQHARVARAGFELREERESIRC